MKTCPNCNELNGENLTKCWRCNASLGPINTYNKICRKCNRIYDSKTLLCEDCGEPLSVYSKEVSYISSSNNNDIWQYVVSALVPLLGIILGCIYIAKDRAQLGKSIIITSIVFSVIITIFILVLYGVFLNRML
ncbi:hypothetical protein RBG61_10830 [Paludicola sp. MB14-C6]|uniref:hypothetical protein n=1 Tax=Paludihabitans sp. MB14-C6 TaxID=3070656 RepID=UPI0027DDEC68|nr:hypothetical protein [Paludicola sp. MB14-C6]WMJ22477.1 hypothetical protein RBG61_10830 [Paludicola sp. MB14-C6]